MTAPKDGPLGPGAAEAARLVQEVQNLGFEAARTVVERFADIFAQFAAGNGGAGTSSAGSAGASAAPPSGFSGYSRANPIGRADMQRAADSYFALLCQLSEAGMRLFDAANWWQPPAAAAPGDLRLPDVAPGGRVSAKVWLHNTTASAAVNLRPWCPGLASHTGASAPAAAVTCTPERIDRLERDASREVTVTLSVGDHAAPGVYHGQLLVDGLPDVVFALRAVVVPASGAR